MKKLLRTLLPLLLAIMLLPGGAYAEEPDLAELRARIAALEAERELDIRLSRSELEGLELVEGPIYVTGHRSPDMDTVSCSMAYAALLRELGYDARAVVLGPINNETRYILELADAEEPPLLEDASGLNMVLVDHSEYSQSAPGLNDAHIIAIIDHHGDGSVTTGGQLIYDARPLGAAATIVWLRYRSYGVEPDQQIAALLLGGVLSDTANLTKSATFADREALKALRELSGITDTDAVYQEMYRVSLSYEGWTDAAILDSDRKIYETGGRRYTIGCVSVYDEAEAAAMAERMKAALPEAVRADGLDMGFAQISIFHDDINLSYLVPSDEAAAEVLATAFPQAVFDGTSYILNPGVSRKKVVVPAVTDVLLAHPAE